MRQKEARKSKAVGLIMEFHKVLNVDQSLLLCTFCWVPGHVLRVREVSCWSFQRTRLSFSYGLHANLQMPTPC